MSAFSRVAAAPLRAWSDERLKRSCARLDAAIAAWAMAWGLDMRCESASCAPLARPAQEIGQAVLLGRRGDAAAWLLEGDDFQRRLHLRMFGRAPSDGSIAEEVASSCRRDLLLRLRDRVGISEESHEELPPGAGTPWSGWVLARLPLECQLVLSPQALQAMLDAAPRAGPPRSPTHAAPLVPLAAALAPCPLRVHAELDGCDIGIDVVQDLQPGDVLRLKHALDAPALVRSPDGKILFGGFMVRHGGRRALELAPRAFEGEL